MDKTYDPLSVESKIYTFWEQGGYFSPKVDKQKKPFTIILPLPNANDPMHMGHALFTVQDIMVRYHRMKGDPTLWLPGGDHAGIETQFVFEKHLAKEGKSRFDYDRNTLYQKIAEFVDKNKNTNKDQMKRLGFSLDWSRYHYSLEPEIVKNVLETFQRMHKDHLAYRAERLVNYCTKCGTAFSDLEINHEEREDQLYYLDYGSIQIATTRPETIFADEAVAVNPKDKRYTHIIGKHAVIPLLNKEIPIIGDDAIDIQFGTGALKVTPAHDPVDFDIGARHKLPVISCIDRFGRLIHVPQKYEGLKVKAAREAVIEDIKSLGLLIKTTPLTHTVGVCYRCKTTIEPMLIPQWYIKTKPLAAPAIQAVKSGKTKIVPLKRFETMYFDWMENIKDWNISRQIVWGPQIPVWYCLDCNPTIELTFIDKTNTKVQKRYQDIQDTVPFTELCEGLQSIYAPLSATYTLDHSPCAHCKGTHLIQETDTFDTWFLSSQWPVNTLKTHTLDFDYFYPTSVLDTLWDILFFWVARMMMMGLYLTGDVPFTVVHLHSRVVDKHGAKMSKSKGNVVNPIEMVEKYGADALRMALIFGAAPGSDISLSEDKIRGMRNFGNKLWNIARLFLMNMEIPQPNPQTDDDQTTSQKSNTHQPYLAIPFYDQSMYTSLSEPDQKIITDLNTLISDVTKDIEKYRFSDSAQKIYEFTWHRFADQYLEENKERFKEQNVTALAVFRHVLLHVLKLLHPFMPFITEEIWGKMPRKTHDPLIISSWPK